MIKDFATIVVCTLAAYLVAIAASVKEVFLYGVPVVLLCAGTSFFVHWIVAIPSLIASSEKYFDFTGMIATLLVVSTAILALLNSGQQVSTRSTIVAIFVSLWTLRLGTFLYKRIVQSGEDKRFKEIKKSLPKFLMAWTLSALWVFLTTVNAITIIALNSKEPLGTFFIIGGALWILGFAFEAVADWQKKNFSELPENRDKFITTGLWAKSRHPNYFGEIVLWAGMAVMSFSSLEGWQYLTLISPIFTYILLVYVSGVRMLEARADIKWGHDENYKKYKSSTPVLWLNFKG